mgnify:FL=1|jgi:uncharacterized membrane protein required for colicin V production
MIFDVIILFALIVSLIVGLVSGFAKQARGLVAFVLAIFLARLLFPIIGSWFTDGALYNGLLPRIDGWLLRQGDIFGQTVPAGITEEQMAAILAGTRLPAFAANLVLKNVDFSNIPADTTFSALLAPSLAKVVASLIGYVILFIVLLILLIVGLWILGKVLTWGILGVIDKVLGAVFSVVNTVIIVSLFLLVLTILAKSIPVVDTFVAKQLATSKLGIFSWLYHNNIVGWLIDKLTKK